MPFAIISFRERHLCGFTVSVSSTWPECGWLRGLRDCSAVKFGLGRRRKNGFASRKVLAGSEFLDHGRHRVHGRSRTNEEARRNTYGGSSETRPKRKSTSVTAWARCARPTLRISGRLTSATMVLTCASARLICATRSLTCVTQRLKCATGALTDP